MTIPTPLSEEEMSCYLELCAEYLLPALNKDQFEHIPDNRTKQLGQELQYRSGRCLAAYMQFYSVGEELATAHRMLARYPWHGTEITKVQHLETTWFLVQNLCYHFKEKAKLFFNEQKRVSKIYGVEQTDWIKNVLKEIDQVMGEAIKDRGNTVHGWNSRVQETYFLSMIEVLEASPNNERDWDLGGHYEDAKFNLRMKSEKYRDCAFSILRRCFHDYNPSPTEIVTLFNELARAVLKEKRILTTRENKT